MVKYDWKLSISPFTFWDKLKISHFLFTEPIWTYGKIVRDYERRWEEKFGVNHAVMVSSGSTANELIALRRKHELQQAGEWPRRNKVIFPVNTWISSVSNWIHLGFEPVFLDVCSDNLNVTPAQLEAAFSKDEDRAIGTVFYTALLGYFNSLNECKYISDYYGARFLMDNCEASFSEFYDEKEERHRPIISFCTNSTSIFFSHFTTSGTEGGLIFCESEEEADWYRMARSHGLTRNMPEKYKNPEVNADFDFYLMGSNYRSHNLAGFMASLDFDRAYKFSMKKREKILRSINDALDRSKYAYFGHRGDLTRNYNKYVPLAVPILCWTKEQRVKVEKFLKDNGIGCRPIIGGSLLFHTAFKGYGNPDDYPVAKWSHNCGLYIGITTDVTEEMIDRLVNDLNNL